MAPQPPRGAPEELTGPSPTATTAEPSTEDVPLEIEVKYGVRDPATLRALLEDDHAELGAGFEPSGPVHLVTVVDRYLDTAASGGRLWQGTMRARLRASDAGVVLTVKLPRQSTGAASTRIELEAPASPVLDPLDWPDSPARAALVAAAGGERLVEIAALRQRRLTRRYQAGGTEVEVSLDQLEALVDDAAVGHRIELEAELKAGSAADLERLAAALVALPGIEAPLGSKLDFALAARGIRRPPALVR